MGDISSTTDSLKMKFLETREFKERDFVRLLIYTLKESGVTSINQKELEDRLYPYRSNEKYKKLFGDVCPVRLGNSLDLSDGFSDIRGWRLVSWKPYDRREMTIMPNSITRKDSIEERYSEEQRTLMQDLVGEHKIRMEAEKKGRHKLNIYGLDPNQTYHLITGEHAGEYNNGIVTWQLITDGIIINSNYHETDVIISCEDPRGEYEGIGLKNAKLRDVTIEGATFAIEQGRMEYGPTVAKLYTKTLDAKALELLAYYSTIPYIPECSETLTKEEPHVYVLKI